MRLNNLVMQVTSLDGTGKPANGRSLMMKVVALGVKKAIVCALPRRVKNTEQALKAIGDTIAAGAPGGAHNEQARVAALPANPAYDHRRFGFCLKSERGEVGW